MGSCFSRSKGRSSVPSSVKEKEDYVHEDPITEDCVPLNGNSVMEPVSVQWDACHLTRERSSVRHYYQRMPSVGKIPDTKIGKTVSEMKIASLFESYKDPNDDCINADGVERLCADLALSPDDFKVLLLAWKLDASQMCRFTRDEFVSGCRAMCVDSVRSMQSRLPEIVSQVAANPDVFKDLYRFTFRFGLDQASGQRILPTDMALVLWRLVFTVREPPILRRWLDFLAAHDQIRGIPRDTWNMFLNFSEAVGDDFSSYDDTEAWPSVFDDFVEYENDQANQNIINKEKELPYMLER